MLSLSESGLLRALLPPPGPAVFTLPDWIDARVLSRSALPTGLSGLEGDGESPSRPKGTSITSSAIVDLFGIITPAVAEEGP